LVLVNGQAFTGNLIIDQPEYRTRVLDTFNAQENEFLQLFTDSEITYFININHVCQVIPSWEKSLLTVAEALWVITDTYEPW